MAGPARGHRRSGREGVQGSVMYRAREPAWAPYICSGTGMPSRSRPLVSTRSVSAHSASRASRSVGLGLQYRAFLVERGEQAGHLEQVGAQAVRFGGLASWVIAAPKPSSRSASARSGGAVIARMRARDAVRVAPGPAEDRPDPGGRVLQVGAGVAPEGDHPVPVEHVVAVPGGGQVGVLHRADADRLGDLVQLGRARTGGASSSFRMTRARSTASCQQVTQLDVVAGPGAQPVAVGAEHDADLRRARS